MIELIRESWLFEFAMRTLEVTFNVVAVSFVILAALLVWLLVALAVLIAVAFVVQLIDDKWMKDK